MLFPCLAALCLGSSGACITKTDYTKSICNASEEPPFLRIVHRCHRMQEFSLSVLHCLSVLYELSTSAPKSWNWAVYGSLFRRAFREFPLFWGALNAPQVELYRLGASLLIPCRYTDATVEVSSIGRQGALSSQPRPAELFHPWAFLLFWNCHQRNGKFKGKEKISFNLVSLITVVGVPWIGDFWMTLGETSCWNMYQHRGSLWKVLKSNRIRTWVWIKKHDMRDNKSLLLCCKDRCEVGAVACYAHTNGECDNGFKGKLKLLLKFTNVHRSVVAFNKKCCVILLNRACDWLSSSGLQFPEEPQLLQIHEHWLDFLCIK